MVNYTDAKIYRIVCNTTGLTYYGSTVQPLSKRLHGHKKDLNCSSKIIIKAGNYDIVLVEAFACKTKEELHARERFYIESNECINKVIPTRTQKEYYAENKEQILAHNKEWREDNKKYYLAHTKEYRDENKEYNKQRRSVKYICECGSNVCLGKKARHNKSQKHLAVTCR